MAERSGITIRERRSAMVCEIDLLHEIDRLMRDNCDYFPSQVPVRRRALVLLASRCRRKVSMEQSRRRLVR
jgi:hypothetical protein